MVEWKRKSNLQAIVRILDFTSPMNMRELPIFLRFSSTMQIFYDAGHASCQHSGFVPPPLPVNTCQVLGAEASRRRFRSVAFSALTAACVHFCQTWTWSGPRALFVPSCTYDGRPPPQLSRSQTAAGLQGGESAELTLS